MAADAFASANTTHTVGNPHDPQLGNGLSPRKLGGDRQSTSSTNSSGNSNSNLSAAAAIVLGLSNLGIGGRSDSAFTGGPSLQTIPFANSALGEGDDLDGGSVGGQERTISKRDEIVSDFK